MELLRKSLPKAAITLATLLVCRNLQPAIAGGIPETGLVMYGALTNASSQGLSPDAIVSWSIKSASNGFTNAATLVNVNGQSFYFLRVLFETRSIAGLPPLPATPNTLELKAPAAVYSRSATVDGSAATLLGPTNFTFGPADRGRTEHLDLLVNLPSLNFSQWLASYGLAPNLNSNVDLVGKGMTLYQDYVAGTDPTNRSSLFKLETNAKPVLQGGQFAGITIEWQSVASKTYSVFRSTDLGNTFSPLRSSVSATPPRNSLSDPTATGQGPYFYRILVSP